MTVGEYLFEFATFTQWVNKAQSWFRNTGVRGKDCICIDSLGRICIIGEQFMRADRENTFPIKVYVATIDADSTANAGI